MQYQSPISLINDSKKSEACFRAVRWQGKRCCPKCHYRRRLYYIGHRYRKCARCSFKFHDFTGTYLQLLQISFAEWAHLIYLFVLGVPSYRCHQYLTVSLKTAQKAYTVCRWAIYDASMAELEKLRLKGEVELDETMYGGHRKGKRGWGATGKHLVFGMYQRNGQVLAMPVPNRETETLLPCVLKHTKPGSLYYSDDWHAYTYLSIKGNHVVVLKDNGRPKAKGRDHINGIEGFWSFSKNWLYQYRGIPQHHFALYLKETEFRFNHRQQNLFHLMVKLLTNSVQKLT